MPGHLPPRPRHGKLHGAQPLPRPPAQQLQLRGAQVKEGGEKERESLAALKRNGAEENS